MDKNAIIERMRELVKGSDVQAMLREVPELETAWDAAHEAAVKAARKRFLDDGGDAWAFEAPKDPLDGTWAELYNLYDDKRVAHKRALAEAEDRNYEVKKWVVDELQNLVDGQMDNIGKAFHRFDELNTRWAETGRVNKARFKALQEEYSRLRDLFYHHASIYKQLQAYDLDKNLEEKKAVIAELKGVLEMDSIRETERTLHTLQETWDGIGPVKQEDWEALKTEYWTTVHAIYDKIRDHYTHVREMHKAIEDEKRRIIQRMEVINLDLPTNHKRWKAATEEVITLQKAFWSAGYTKRSKNRTFNEIHRTLCDTFFEAKQAFYDKQRARHDERKAKKEALIEKAEALQDSRDWGPTTKRLIDLQKQWKKVGPAHPRDEGRLWKRFRGACDTFFTTKKQWFDGRDDREKANLEAKDAICTRMGDVADTEALQALIAEWNAIGFVPKKAIKSSQKRFDEARAAAAQRLAIDPADLDTLAFEAKVKGLAGQTDAKKALDDERRFVRGRIKGLTEEVEQYRTNLSFFGPSKGAQTLRAAAEKRIEESEAELERWKEKLRMIQDAMG